MKIFAHSLALICLLLVAPQGAPGAEAKDPIKPKPVHHDQLFSEPKVLQLKIEIPPASIEALKKDPKAYVKATIREGDKAYADAGVRLKGHGVFEADKKPSLALKFNEFTSGLHFHGHTKLFLENAHQDPTFLAEALGNEIFRAADVPAAKVTFARVELNGADLGLYVVEQAVNREFLADYFSKTKGNLYEGVHADISDKLERDAGDTSKDQSDLKKAADAAKEPDPAQRLKKLAVVVDLDRFISFAATEVLLCHNGGYSLARNNYRVYHDPLADRLVFIPHSADQLFGKADAPLLPAWKGLLAKAVFDNPEGQRRYRERMAAILGKAGKVETLHARLNELAGKIRPALAVDPARAKAFDTALATLRDRIAQRMYFIEQELKKPVK